MITNRLHYAISVDIDRPPTPPARVRRDSGDRADVTYIYIYIYIEREREIDR